MRKTITIGCAVLIGCTRPGASADSAAARDSGVAAGPAAAPTTLAPVGDSARPGAPAIAPPSAGAPAPSSGSPPASSASQSSPADSVRGIVSVVGTSFEKQVVVAARGSGQRVEITGRLASLVGHVAGADVSVVGRLTAGKLEATRFVVKSVDGQPAIDGTLRTEGSALYIVTAGGARTRIVAPPPPLLGQDGARVWITGDPSRGVSSFGFIDPPR
ncbi:MAG TPA: hypothetical protein VFO55_02000 [Gemmatimonadaceae bacterium]|nr:hypothetical protein [Gemmatimonadaceae bacterium]